ncbi:MAG: ABC transporter permease [Saprospiraceae bacterium]
MNSNTNQNSIWRSFVRYGRYLAQFVFSLFLLAILSFFLLNQMPGDPVLQWSGLGEPNQTKQFDRRYSDATKTLHLNLPEFYFSIHAKCFPDTFYKTNELYQQDQVRSLLWEVKNWPALTAFLNAEKKLRNGLSEESLTQISKPLSNIKSIAELRKFQTGQLREFQSGVGAREDTIVKTFDADIRSILNSSPVAGWWIPVLCWHGQSNQFHNWGKELLTGNGGVSWVDGRAVWSKIDNAFWITLRLSLTALLLSFLIAIPIALFLSLQKRNWLHRLILLSLDFVFTIPLFWLASLTIVFVLGPVYFNLADYFPSFEMAGSASWTGLILPWICIMPGLIAYLSRFLFKLLEEEIHKPYAQQAIAKGLSRRKWLSRHGLRNAAIPYIYTLTMAIPAAIAGSLVLEILFSIPGMGRLTFMSVISRDWPVLFALVMLNGLLTLTGYLVGNIVVSYLDPRLRIPESTNQGQGL